jgi:tripartite-type tricarboxylate transporter receptor subunit TctC
VFAPAGTPPAVIERLNREIVAIVHQADVQKKLKDLGVEPVGSTAQELASLQKQEIGKWGKVIRDAGITSE